MCNVTPLSETCTHPINAVLSLRSFTLSRTVRVTDKARGNFGHNSPTDRARAVVPNLFSVMDSFDDLAESCGPL